MKEKNNKWVFVTIVILLLLVLSLGGFLVYDKVITKETEKTSKIETNENLLTAAEALSLGKEKYKYIRDGLYLCGTNQIKYDNNQRYTITDLGVQPANDYADYAKITNIDEIKSNLTKHAFSDWIYWTNIKPFENEYYLYVGGCGSNPTHPYDKYEIDVKEISENRITYTIYEYLYTTINDNEIVEDITKANKIANNFEIVKENNTWKINEYTDVDLSYFNQ